jgi:hypothetical protein
MTQNFLSGAQRPTTTRHWKQTYLKGRYDGITVGVRKRLSSRFTLESSYTWTKAIDNALNSHFTSDVQTGRGAGSLGSYGPTDYANICQPFRLRPSAPERAGY